MPLRVWAILGARPGDNDQVLALADALQLPVEIKPLHYNRWRHVGPRLLGRSLASLTRNSRELILAEDPPDLTISAGHRSVPVVQALRRRSRGRMRTIHIGFPRVSPGRFDLVIAPPQYPIPDHPHLLRLPFALTRAATAAPGPADKALSAQLPAPRQLLIVGGPNLFWTLDEEALLSTLGEMLGAAAKEGGAVLVTTSPRTPAPIREAIKRKLANCNAPSLLAEPGQVQNYASLLAAADTIRVTADSVSMVSDAIWTGKPLALVPIKQSTLGRIVMRASDAIDQALYPQDLRIFWRTLSQLGLGNQLAVPGASPAEELRRVLVRVDPLLDGLTAASAGAHR